MSCSALTHVQEHWFRIKEFRTVRDELKRSIFNRSMFLVILVMVSILGSALLQYGWGWKQQDILTLIAAPMAISGFTPFAGMFPALPGGLQFVRDYNSGYIVFLLIRDSKWNYIKKRIVCTVLSGGTAVSSSFLILFLAAVILGVPVTESAVAYLSFYEGTIWWPYVTLWGGVFVLCMKVVLAFLFGAVWSIVCLLFSVIAVNQYVAFTLTFVVYQIFWFVFSGKKYNPIYLLRGDSTIYTCLAEPFLIQGVVLGSLVLVTAILFKRRLDHA